jgi:hypothetical protein
MHIYHIYSLFHRRFLEYSNVVNPLFLANPELAGVMSTASRLKCAYSRPRLRSTPPLPANAIDVQIPEQYRNVKVAGGEEVPFLLVDLSYPTVANGIVDGRILVFCKNQFIRIICAFEYGRSIFNLSANLLSVFHNPYIPWGQETSDSPVALLDDGQEAG